MNHQDSFQYVFFDLLDILNNLEIVYQHEALIHMQDDDISTYDGTSNWHLRIVRFGKAKSKKDFESPLSTTILSTIEYIKENRIDLYSFYEAFVEEIGKIKSNFDQLIKLEIPLKELIDKEVIKVNYIGYLPIDQHDGFYQLGVNFPTSPPEHDEFAYDEVYKLSREYFAALSKELLKLYLFLRHEYNLTTINQDAFKNNKEKKELLSLLKKGEISNLFELLNGHPVYEVNETVILLSAQFYQLEKMKIENTIDDQDYWKRHSSICSSLLSVIRKE